MAGLDGASFANSLADAARTAAAGVAEAGRDLSGDIQNYVIPQARELASELVLIADRVGPNGLTAQDGHDLAADAITHTIQTVSEAVAELTALEVQAVINGAIAAVSAVANTALGFKLL